MGLISEVKEGFARLDNSPRELKKFGITLAITLTILSGLILILGSQPLRAFWTGGFAVAFLFFALLFPGTLGPFRILWMTLSFILGYFMSRLILTLIFLLLITPVRGIMLILGKDILHLSLKQKKESYWILREQKKKTAKEFEQLY